MVAEIYPDHSEILSEKFLEKYKNKNPKWGFNGLGYVVYKRTYSRIKQDGSREEWADTVERCIRGAQKIGAKYTKEEAEKLFDLVFNLKCNFAGRMLWQLGTSTVDRFGANSLINCFQYDTKIITDEGVKKIGDLSGQSVNLMTEYGKYVKSEIKDFGKQKLVKLVLNKGNSYKEIYTTAGHRWFRYPHRSKEERNLNRQKIECTTSELSEGDTLFSVYGQSYKNCSISNFGIAHGIVFGDGSVCNNSGSIRLCGEKNYQLIRFFNQSTTGNVKDSEDVIVYNLPSYFKNKPSINIEKSYLLGWLMGYFAADGCISENGQITISSASVENIEFVRDVCIKLGICHSQIRQQERVGIGQTEESSLFTIGINGYDLTEDFFIIKEHKNRFKNHTYEARRNWKVHSISTTDIEENVYCAIVPETRSFALEGNILTGNCFYTNISNVEDFCFLFENLMLGGGVSPGIRKEHIHELPKIKKNVFVSHKETKDADFIVPDSREGWVELLRKVLNAFFHTGVGFSYSTILVRGYGEKIKGFGGTASGPQILIDGIANICKVLLSREEKKLRSIDVLDICNIIGSIVVAGNVRRTAQLALGDSDDFLFLRAKRWDLGNIPNWRAMSNNTIVADDFDYTSNEFWNGYAGNGEPYGLFNLNLSQNYGRLGEKINDKNVAGTNPCQPANATVITRNGISTIGQVKIGDEIWSETGWTKVCNKWSTGIKEVYKYRTSAGLFLGTQNHRIVENQEKIEIKDAVSIDILNGPQFNDFFEFNTQAILDGLVLGDGGIHKASNNLIVLYIGKDDKDYLDSEIKNFIKEHRPGITEEAWEVETNIKVEELPHTYERVIPNRYLKDKSILRSLLRGLYSANGSVVSGRITLKTTSSELRDQIQIYLSSLGIRSYFTTNQAKETKFSNGTYLCKESYDINITSDRERFYNLIGFIQKYKNEKLKHYIDTIKSSKTPKNNYEIRDIEFVGCLEVFDITVDNDTHTYWSGGLNVSNCGEISLEDGESCNLAELYLNNISSKEELITCAKLIYKTQKAISALPYLHKKTNDIVHKNMRLGLGITGICQSFDKLEWLDDAYKALKAFDKEWSKKNNWPTSIKLTTCKPSGTLSILSGSTPGVHPGYSEYYIRRVRMSSSDPLIEHCKSLGFTTEFLLNFDGTQDHKTIIVEFPCKLEDGIVAEKMSAIEQLDLVKKIQTLWSDNAVSVTVYYKDEELDQIKEWLKKNYKDSIKSVSFLRHNNHGFKQAPYEKISKEEYEKLIKNIKPISSLNSESGDFEIDSVECANGVCPIK